MTEDHDNPDRKPHEVELGRVQKGRIEIEARNGVEAYDRAQQFLQNASEEDKAHRITWDPMGPVELDYED